jgi:hypothetical protein
MTYNNTVQLNKGKTSHYTLSVIHNIMCKHFTVLSSFMIYHWVCNYINMMGVTSGAGTVYPSGETEFTPVFSWVRVTLVLCVMFCRSLIVLLSFFIWPPSSIYGLWWPLWYLLSLLMKEAIMCISHLSFYASSTVHKYMYNLN